MRVDATGILDEAAIPAKSSHVLGMYAIGYEFISTNETTFPYEVNDTLQRKRPTGHVLYY